MTFDRYEPSMQRTFALRAFNAHETEINRHYWSFKVINDYCSYQAREAKESDNSATDLAQKKETLTATLFHASGVDAARIPKTVSDWLRANVEFENWLRLSILISASAYLETYLRQVTQSALMSDPLCRLGLSRGLDGLKLVKVGKELNYENEFEVLTKGHWEQRKSGFLKIFGGCPSELANSVKDLERIRKMRNNYAHGFGRNLDDIPSPINKSPGNSERITPKHLMKHVATISKVAAGIDKFLLHRVIGNFELLLFYHEFKSKPVEGREKIYNSQRQLKRSLQRNAKVSVSIAFCRDLISYYDSV